MLSIASRERASVELDITLFGKYDRPAVRQGFLTIEMHCLNEDNLALLFCLAEPVSISAKLRTRKDIMTLIHDDAEWWICEDRIKGSAPSFKAIVLTRPAAGDEMSRVADDRDLLRSIACAG